MSGFLSSKPSTPTQVATVQPKPVVNPAPAVSAGAGKKEEGPKAPLRRGIPRRLSATVLGSVAGETRKAKLGD